LLTSDEKIKKINQQWRKKNKATDVLSFPQHSLAELKVINKKFLRNKKLAEWQLGDIVISLPTAKQQAEEKGHSFRHELAWLCAHGILHLLGFDHEISPAEARRMRRWEKHLLTR
jgi:probable rRNA maturation factor